MCTGNIIALINENEEEEYSLTENILNFSVTIVILWYWQVIIMWNIAFGMIFAPIETMTEKVKNVPSFGLESWALDTIFLFKRFQENMNLTVFLFTTSRYA